MAGRAVDDLLALFGDRPIAEPLIAQFLGAVCADVLAGIVAPTAPLLPGAAVTRVIKVYAAFGPRT